MSTHETMNVEKCDSERYFLSGFYPRKVEIPLSHVQQRANWDCGLACVLMVLRDWQRRELIENFEAIRAEEGFHESLWTIDLAYLLKRFGVPHEYCTITLGVDSSYLNKPFYQEVHGKEEQRVVERFGEAQRVGVSVTKRSCSFSEIIVHLSHNTPAIVLVDARFIGSPANGDWIDKVASTVDSISKLLVSYQGHFIVLCGYNFISRQILYRNPAFRGGLHAMSFEAFEKARKSHGTDEDVIFIHST